MRKIILLFSIVLIMMPALLYAQSGRVITGTVKDIGGVLPGASVSEKGAPGNATAADGNGKFRITLKGSSNTLIVKFIGYVNQEVKIGADNSIDITMQPNSQGLDEVSIVGFTPRKRITSTGAVSSINASEIRTVPTANVQNALAGKLPGFFSQQTSGQPGKDASDFFIRGVSSINASNRPLILVDDIEYSYSQLQQINVNEIETINILKDASTTAIYGIKGANGVLIVTTRRGKAGSPKFNLRVEGGIQSPTRTPKFLNSFDAATLITEAELNDGLVPTFTSEDLELFKNGTDPYGHPDVDWYNKIFRKSTYQVNTNLDISGGNERVKYFISGGAFKQNGNTRPFNDPQGLVNTNYYFSRYNFRSNLDLKANKTLNLRLDVTTRFSDINAPGLANPIATIYDFRTQTPFSAPFLNPNGSYAYNNSKFTPNKEPTLNAKMANGGYDHERRTDFNVLIGAIQNLDAITKGLSLTGRVAYASSENFNKGTSFLRDPKTAFPSYYYNPEKNTYTLLPKAPYVNKTYTYYGNTDLNESNLNLQLFANYDRTFAQDHHFTGLLLFNQTSKKIMANPPENFRGVSAKAGYDYKQKILFDFNIAYNGSDRFASNRRFSFFPAVGAGYVFSRDEYFKKAFPAVSLFKLRASYGVVGSDGAPGDRYIYIQNYTSALRAYNFGESRSDMGGIFEGGLANPFAVWEKVKKADIGLDMNLWGDKVNVTVDVFRDIRYDAYVQRGGVPAILGVAVPYENLGKTRNQGFDGVIGYRTQIGKFQFNTSFVFSYAKNKILEASEANPAFANLRTTGHPIGQPFGLISEGYYTQDEVDYIRDYISRNGSNEPIAGQRNIPVPDYAFVDGNQLHAGDLKYKDIAGARDADGNVIGDGIINIFDRTAIGNPNLPNTTLGLTLGGSYKGFSINVLFQGSFNYSYLIKGNGIEPFQSQFQPIHMERWTPETASTANFPRLSTNFIGTVNSPTSFPSNYWYVDAFYVRLKTVDIGYQLPSNLLPFKINNARIYMSGYNLITWNNFNKYQQDPEVSSNSAGDQYINARVINLGVQMGF